MKKFSFFLSCAASAMFAIALTSCEAVQDNPSGGDPSKQAITIQHGDTLATIYQQLAATTDNIVIGIPAGVDTVYTGKIELTPGQTFSLIGDEKNPPVVVPTASMKFANAFTIKNVIFDCEQVEEANHLLMMISEPDEDLKVESGQYVIKQPVLIENVVVKGLSKAFFYDNGKPYAFESFTINNCIVGYKAQGNLAINLAASMAINFSILNSTFYSVDKETSTSNFIGLSGKRPWQITGYEEGIGKLLCQNNTFANVAYKKQFLNTNTLKGQVKYTYVVKNNIFFNTSNKKIYANMTNTSAKQQVIAENNVYLWDGTFFAETSFNGDGGVQLDPKFKALEEGNFRPTNVAFLNLETIPGDPRWTKWVY